MKKITLLTVLLSVSFLAFAGDFTSSPMFIYTISIGLALVVGYFWSRYVLSIDEFIRLAKHNNSLLELIAKNSNVKQSEIEDLKRTYNNVIEQSNSASNIGEKDDSAIREFIEKKLNKKE